MPPNKLVWVINRCFVIERLYSSLAVKHIMPWRAGPPNALATASPVRAFMVSGVPEPLNAALDTFFGYGLFQAH